MKTILYALNKMKTRYRMILVAAMFLVSQAASADEGMVSSIVAPLTDMICELYDLFIYIASGVAALVMGIAGLKWVGSENDPGARKQAKETIIHAIIGLIIVVLAGEMVQIMMGDEISGAPC